jgi:hypothetical protein
MEDMLQGIENVAMGYVDGGGGGQQGSTKMEEARNATEFPEGPPSPTGDGGPGLFR